MNAAFNFQSQTSSSSDNGIGLPATSSRAWRFFGCAAGTGGSAASIDTASVAMPNATGADIPECSSDNQGGWNPSLSTAAGAYNLKTRGPYTVAYTETDVLGNLSYSPLSQRLGVDKTAPLIRFSTSSAADTAWGSASRSVQAEVIDERAGFIDGNDVNAVLRMGSSTYQLQPTVYGSFQHFATRGASSANPQTLNRASSNNFNCINPNSLVAMNTSTTNPFANANSTATGGANPVTNPSCPFINQGNNGASIGIFARCLTATVSDGGHVQQPRHLRLPRQVYDRAGNVSEVLSRAVAVDNGPARRSAT